MTTITAAAAALARTWTSERKKRPASAGLFFSAVRYAARVPFPYYARLSRPEKEVYRRSDALARVPIPRPSDLRVLLPEVEAALSADDRRALASVTSTLVSGLLDQLGAPPAVARVLAVRPGDGESELHGLYEAREGEVPELKVWMRTHARKQPVAKKSFVRTVLHEVCHHLDFFLFDLDPSFHTEGFFKRESHLARQLFDDGDLKRRLGVQPAPAPKRGQLGFDF